MTDVVSASTVPQRYNIVLLSSFAAIALLLAANGIGGMLAVQKAGRYLGYALVWADEFDRDGAADPAYWTYERGFVRNRELQWYQPDNARVAKGLLVIEGRRERVRNPAFEAGSTDWKRAREFADYTSASLLTRGLHSWQYGRFEMRARIATHDGLWPAFWTLGVAGSWPHNGEIDIMEYYRGVLLANVAWGGASRFQAVWADSRKPIASFNRANWAAGFHVWRMDWDEHTIRLSVDGQVLNDVDLSRTVNQDGTGTNPLQQPHYLLVNLAIGGTQGGDPSRTAFPTRYEIDYVRVYQRAKRAGPPSSVLEPHARRNKKVWTRIISLGAEEIDRLVRHEKGPVLDRPLDSVGLGPPARALGLAEHGHGGRFVRRARPVGGGAREGTAGAKFKSSKPRSPR